jgi:adenylate cyclase
VIEQDPTGRRQTLGPMQSVRIHAVVFTAVNTMLIAIWLVSGGVGSVFWPIWPLITWGSALMIHGGVVAGLGRPGRTGLSSGSGFALDEGLPEAEAWPRELEAGAERRWVAVMFVDIVGSTTLNDEMGDDRWHGILTEHRNLVRAAVREGGGSEVGTAGDGCLARFDSPTEAVLCAIDLQRQIANRNRTGHFAPQVRIGIHAGEAIHADRDLLGNVVNLASRVADQAQGAEILVTEPVADAVGSGLAFDDRGLQPLKGLSRPRHLLAVEWSADLDGRPIA